MVDISDPKFDPIDCFKCFHRDAFGIKSQYDKFFFSDVYDWITDEHQFSFARNHKYYCFWPGATVDDVVKIIDNLITVWITIGLITGKNFKRAKDNFKNGVINSDTDYFEIRKKRAYELGLFQ